MNNDIEFLNLCLFLFDFCLLVVCCFVVFCLFCFCFVLFYYFCLFVLLFVFWSLLCFLCLLLLFCFHNLLAGPRSFSKTQAYVAHSNTEVIDVEYVSAASLGNSLVDFDTGVSDLVLVTID